MIKEQGVTSLQDALKNVPGITLNAGEGGTHGDLVNLRGFSAGEIISWMGCAIPASITATSSIMNCWRC